MSFARWSLFLLAALMMSGLRFREPAPARLDAAPLEQRRDQYGDLLPLGARTRIGTSRYRIHDQGRGQAFSRDARYVAISYPIGEVGGGGTILLVETATGKTVWIYRWKGGHGLDDVAFTPNGRALLVHIADEFVFLDVATGRPLKKFLEGRGCAGHHFTISPDGKTLAAIGSGVEVWNLTTGRKTREFRLPERDIVERGILSADANVVAMLETKENDYRVRLWDVTTGQELPPIRGSGRSSGCSLSADGRSVFVSIESKQI